MEEDLVREALEGFGRALMIMFKPLPFVVAGLIFRWAAIGSSSDTRRSLAIWALVVGIGWGLLVGFASPSTDEQGYPLGERDHRTASEKRIDFVTWALVCGSGGFVGILTARGSTRENADG